MFGYVKPFKPDLRICEFETYKGVYCSLCRELGTSYGLLSRMFLNYDFTFLTILFLSVSNEQVQYKKAGCIAHPLKKRMYAEPNDTTRLVADLFVLTLYYKITDNIRDSGFWKGLPWRIAKLYFGHLRKKALTRAEYYDQILKDYIDRQFSLEKKSNVNIDEACAPTADMMSAVCGSVAQSVGQRRVLERFGYFFGRYIYLMDAYDDYERDSLCGGFNPLSDPSEAKELIFASLGELSLSYELLSPTRFKGILDNIVFFGLNRTVDDIARKKEKRKGYDDDRSV